MRSAPDRHYIRDREEPCGVLHRIQFTTPHNRALRILQRIFSSATRREMLGRHFKGGRRGGELKIDWTKPLSRAWPMCIDCRRDLWRGSKGVGSGQRRGLLGCFAEA